MHSAWPFVRVAALELWPVAIIGTLGGIALALFADLAPTLSLGAVAFAGLWGGVVAGGGNVKLAHLLARPVARGRMLALRVGTLAALLLPCAAMVYGFGLVYGSRAAGPSAAIMFVAIAICMLSGVLAGALADTETGSVGVGMIGAAIVLVPPFLFATTVDVTWARIDTVLGWMQWPFAIAIVASSSFAVTGAWSDLPRRSSRTRVRAASRVLGVAALHFALGWAPLVVAAASPRAGEAIGLLDGPGDARILLTGSRHDRDDPLVDGIALLDGGERHPLFSSSALNSLIGESSGSIQLVRPSPDGDHLALVVRESDRRSHVVVVRISTGAVFEVGRFRGRGPVWSQDGTHLLSSPHPTTVYVHRVGEDGVELVSSHDLNDAGMGVYSVAEGFLPALAVVDGLVSETDTPTDLGGGWIGDRVFAFKWQPVPMLRVFDGSTHVLRSIPIDPELVRDAVTTGWLDDEHIAILTRRAFDLPGSIRRLSIIDLDGRVVTKTHVMEWSGFVKIEGPPSGPWLVVTKSGHVQAWSTSGRRLWSESVQPYARNMQLPFAREGNIVAGIDRHGRVWERSLPWKDGSR
jgi:hypothetical protein